MIIREVERREHVPVILDLGAFGYGESQTGEDRYDLLAHERQRMACAERHRCGCAEKIHVIVGLTVFAGGCGVAQSGDGFGGEVLEFVEFLSEFAFLFR